MGDCEIVERLKFAAILRSDMCIVFGRDHAECFTKSPKGTCDLSQQHFGFLTNRFRFVLRKEAAKIAFDAGQISKWEDGDIIVSEQLWDTNTGGKYKYDEKLGYYIEVDFTAQVAKILEEADS